MLAQIVETTEKAVKERKEKVPLSLLKERVAALPQPRSLAQALTLSQKPRIIAEIKRASPSAGILRKDLSSTWLARRYQKAGAVAISVLTEQYYFQGNLEDLRNVKDVVEIPVLQKDFILDPYQIYEARAYGADAILLIACLHPKERLQELYLFAKSLGLSVLLEIHDEMELEKALLTKAHIIGINNRNLATLKVDQKIGLRLLPMIPKDRIKVIESGLKRREEIKLFMEKGASAFLIGESLLRAPDPAAALAQFLKIY